MRVAVSLPPTNTVTFFEPLVALIATVRFAAEPEKLRTNLPATFTTTVLPAALVTATLNLPVPPEMPATGLATAAAPMLIVAEATTSSFEVVSSRVPLAPS